MRHHHTSSTLWEVLWHEATRDEGRGLAMSLRILWDTLGFEDLLSQSCRLCPGARDARVAADGRLEGWSCCKTDIGMSMKQPTISILSVNEHNLKERSLTESWERTASPCAVSDHGWSTGNGELSWDCCVPHFIQLYSCRSHALEVRTSTATLSMAVVFALTSHNRVPRCRMCRAIPAS